MVLPTSPSVGYSPSTRASSLSQGWAPPLVSPSTAGGGSVSTRKPTPIPPKRSFSLNGDKQQQQLVEVALSPFALSPLQAYASRLLDGSQAATPDSGTHRLAVPSCTPAAVESPCSSPLLSVRHCLPLASSPLSEARQLPLAPPSSPAPTVLDKITNSAAFQQLAKQAAAARGAEEAEDEEGGEEGTTATFLTSSDEKRRSLSSSNRRAVDWMPVLVE